MTAAAFERAYDEFMDARKAACGQRVAIDDMIDGLDYEIQRLSSSEQAMMAVGFRPHGPDSGEMRKLAVWEALRTRLIEIKGAEKEVVKVLAEYRKRKSA